MISPITAQRWGLSPLRIADGITNRELSKILKEAAADAERIIERQLRGSTAVGAQVRQAQLQAVVKGIRPISTDLWSQTGKITRVGMFETAQEAADQSIAMDKIAGMPRRLVKTYQDVMHFEATQVVEDILSRHTDGFTLAERIYRHGLLTTKQVGHIVDKSLALQRSAREIAREVRNHFLPNVPGGTSYASMRLARTEINNAHHTTTIRMAADKPWVHGMKWTLSSSHPRPDPCDEYAGHNEGLGTGVWEDPPSKPHPQCFCYVTAVTEDSSVFLQRLFNGDFDRWLKDHESE